MTASGTESAPPAVCECGHEAKQHESACWACRREGKTCLYFRPAVAPTPAPRTVTGESRRDDVLAEEARCERCGVSTVSPTTGRIAGDCAFCGGRMIATRGAWTMSPPPVAPIARETETDERFTVEFSRAEYLALNSFYSYGATRGNHDERDFTKPGPLTGLVNAMGALNHRMYAAIRDADALTPPSTHTPRG